MTEQDKGITKPVTVNGATPAKSPAEGTQPVEVTPDASQAQLPEWLLKFASSPEQSADENQLADEPDFLTPFPVDLEDEEVFTPPEMPGGSEWQELAEFQDLEALDLEPVQEVRESTAEVEDFKEPEAALEPDLVEDVVESIAIDPRVEAANSFKQEVRDLLKKGQREEALALIRDNKTDPVMAEAAKKTLRSQLTLSSDASDLWDIYDELNSSSD